MEWNECTCQLCCRRASFKELDTPQQKKYSCPVCLEYIMAFQLKDYPVLKDQISQYQSEIAESLQQIRKGCKGCIEIVLHANLVKDQNQISLDQLVEKARGMRKQQ